MKADQTAEALAEDLQDALALLDGYRSEKSGADIKEPLPSLLEQCQVLCDGLDQPKPLRLLHSLACTGGTLFSKSLAALPNVALLSEIDPLSKMDIAKPGSRPRFAPTDLIYALNHTPRRVDDTVKIEVFRASVQAASTELARRGVSMIIRDHAHSQFCTRADANKRPTLREMLLDDYAVLSVTAVRHPLDSYLSLCKNDWRHFEPFSLREYCHRVLMFLDRHQDSRLVRYEDFVRDPDAMLQDLCAYLSLSYSPLALDLLSAVHLSGDSGRTGAQIAVRPRREIPPEVDAERRTDTYLRVCERLEYDP